MNRKETVQVLKELRSQGFDLKVKLNASNEDLASEVKRLSGISKVVTNVTGSKLIKVHQVPFKGFKVTGSRGETAYFENEGLALGAYWRIPQPKYYIGFITDLSNDLFNNQLKNVGDKSRDSLLAKLA